MLAGIGFVAVFAGAANTPLATIVMATELFGPEIAPLAAIACIASYLVSGHTGIYHAQRVGHGKHHRPLPEEIRLSDIRQFHARAKSENEQAASLVGKEK
jgi:H+/Cl- antiporter ClcA